MHEILQDAQNQIAEGYTAEAVDLLRNFIAGQPRDGSPAGKRMAGFYRELIMKAGEIRDLAGERRRGVITQDQATTRKAQINANVLDLIDEIDGALAKAQTPLPPPTPSVNLAPPQESALEKVWSGTLQSISWLYKGVEASRSICRVVSPAGLGTGFLVAPGIVLTNNHVVPSAEAAAGTVVEFNFEEDAAGRLRAHSTYPVDPKASFVTSPIDKLDCTILRILEADGQPPLSSWGVLQLVEGAAGSIAVGAHVTIIQHPSGGPKKIAATANEVVNIFEQRLQYMTDTMPGSSGSPVFNDAWKVVAIHHSGGNIVKNALGERFFANEGILISKILDTPEFRQVLLPPVAKPAVQ